jgi:polyisoprenyl-teichoic acid--peptidoglycan teichoic acid transferase
VAAGEKPYRVYRGGRTKGKVPLQRRVAEEERLAQRGGRGPFEPSDNGRAQMRRPRRRWSWKRRIAVTLVLMILVLIVWAVAGYFAVRSGVSGAHERLPANVNTALAHQDGLLLSHSTDILLLGTDHSALAARQGLEHSDSIMLLRTDPSKHRLIYLSIPRDLRVSIPGHGDDKINAAMQIGGPALAAQTVAGFTGLPVNHVVVVDFGSFEDLIDKVGGVDVNVPEAILSNRFDCPYSTSTRCQQWEGWRFEKGVQHMSGHRALIYSRIRENRLNPSESDVTRGERQQQVMQALLSKLASPSMFFKLPFVGGDLLKPITTDLSANQFVQLGWIKFRAGKVLHCRLGGTAETIGGGSYIVSTEENRAVIQMVQGNSAPQPPPPGSGPFGPGCVTGSQHFK